MMRKMLFAVAALVIVAGGAATSRAQQDGSGLYAGVSAEDRAFYANAARVAAVHATVDEDAPWSLNGRSGVARFGAPDANQCRSFFLRQMAPDVRPAVLGKLCVGPTRPSIAGGESPPNLVVSDIRAASAAGPSGEGVHNGSGPSRGITIPPQRPSPPPSPSPPSAPNQPRTGQINVKPVLVQINRQTARENQNGGHAVVLLRDTPAARARNLATCEALLRHFDDAPISEVRIGVRREADGSISALRPIYWPVNERVTVVGDRCAQRLQRYDFTRATTIRDKLRITGDGPYLVVSRSDERLATTIDLTGLSNADIEKAAIYFRDGLSQRGNVWDPQSFTRQRQEQSLIASFGANFPRVLLAAVRFYAPMSGASASQTPPPCLGDLTDTRRC